MAKNNNNFSINDNKGKIENSSIVSPQEIDDFEDLDQPIQQINEGTNETIDESSQRSEVAGIQEQIAGSAMETAGDAMEAAGTAEQAAGTAVSATGVGVEVAGDAAQAIGKGTEIAGSGVNATGKAISGAGQAIAKAGASLSGTGAGAILGAPLAVLGGATTAVGKGTEAVGTRMKTAGTVTNKAGKSIETAGKAIRNTGKNVSKKGTAIKKNGKSLSNLGKKCKEYGNRKRNGIDSNKSKLNGLSNGLLDLGDKIKGKIKIPKKLLLILSIALIGILPIIIICIGIVIFDFSSSSSSSVAGGFYQPKCNEVSVVFVDEKNGYQATGTETFDLEEYVAGVVYAEVGGFNNVEVYKAFAIAARSYLENNIDSSCSIEASPRKQAFKDISNMSNDTANKCHDAANETTGVVLMKNGSPFSSMYDALSVESVDDNYYTLTQKEQKIPKNWIESHISSQTLEFYKEHSHGQGMSQWGSLYLASEEDYKYQDILNFYFADDAVGLSISEEDLITSVAGLEIKTTTNSTGLDIPLSTFLEQRGSSINNINSFIHDNVESAGVGTREGVVTAAVSLINYLYDNYKVNIPYFWGGNYQKNGVSPNFGESKISFPSPSGKIYNYAGFDCSGFASWAIKNGGYMIPRYTTTEFDNKFKGDSCEITSSTCIGQPGDLINARGLHVQMIVSVNEESGQYMMAEASSGGLTIKSRNMHDPISGKTTLILRMNNFYSNSSNIDPNY